jgi:hypothetical protein
MEQWFGKASQDPRDNHNLQHTYDQYDHDTYHLRYPALQSLYTHDN